MMVFLWFGSSEADSFNINQSFFILFMVIIGGLGSLVGSFFGAIFIWGVPMVLRTVPPALGLTIPAATVERVILAFHAAIVSLKAIGMMLVIRLQQPIPLGLEIMVAAQFLVFLALPTMHAAPSGVRRR